MGDEKIRENRLRRMASRQGYRLQKSRRRDPLALDYGTFNIIDVEMNALMCEGLDLDEVEAWLTEG